MRRYRSETNDSLDLLLDTMCNSFGGVMFIAMMMVIIGVQTPKNRSDEDAARQYRQAIGHYEIAVQSAKNTLATLSLDAGALDESHRRRLVNVDKNQIMEAMNLQHAVQEREAADRLMVAEIAVLHARSKELAGQAEACSEDSKLVSDAVNALKTTIAEQEAAKKQMQAAIDQPLAPGKAMYLDFARLAPVAKEPFWMMLDGGKLYRLNRYDRAFELADKRSHSPDIACVWQPEYSSGLFSPAAGRGLPVDDRSQTQMAALFAPVDTGRYFINISVREDSFETWQHVRQFLVGSGHRYTWSPLIMDEPLKLILSADVNYESY